MVDFFPSCDEKDLIIKAARKKRVFFNLKKAGMMEITFNSERMGDECEMRLNFNEGKFSAK